ncbi:MAG: hypothetical protein ACYCU0_00530 [Solirubrobacteraceae bacterium]
MRSTLERVLAASLATVSAFALASPGASAEVHAQAAMRPRSAAARQPAVQRHAAAQRSSEEAAVLRSPQLWATVDLCTAGKQPVVGVRGSMPADGHAHDAMYMSFGIQYLESATGKWAYLSNGDQTPFVRVGAATATRQAGRDFHLASAAAGTTFRLRGVVRFQWRRGGKAVLSATRQTSGEHGESVMHAEPSGFSAATCSVE